jgi:hypothetical protein
MVLSLAPGPRWREGNLLILGDDRRPARLNTGSHLDPDRTEDELMTDLTLGAPAAPARTDRAAEGSIAFTSGHHFSVADNADAAMLAQAAAGPLSVIVQVIKGQIRGGRPSRVIRNTVRQWIGWATCDCNAVTSSRSDAISASRSASSSRSRVFAARSPPSPLSGEPGISGTDERCHNSARHANRRPTKRAQYKRKRRRRKDRPGRPI